MDLWPGIDSYTMNLVTNKQDGGIDENRGKREQFPKKRLGWNRGDLLDI